ncbi:MAG TPA: glycosyltransferase family 2 protein, partial [Solibacterales bacterium]|nr:glycosyltransferase family 2 protein [Bryobacterales bacterium]
MVVDNSGRALAGEAGARDFGASIIENKRNLGFGAAVNQGIRQSRAEYVAVLNDDAEAHPAWLAALVKAMDANPGVGMCASQVRLAGTGLLDSAGMLLCADGSSKQRGHGQPAAGYPALEEALFPSGSAALYRRRMLDETGLFDEDFFLYCEDTDLGLRARWAGWRCLYVPGAVVDHRYSHSAGRASALKAYYVERNRVFTVLKNFPLRMLLRVPFAAVARYWWHLVSMRSGRN